MSYTTEESQYLLISSTIKKMKHLCYWMDYGSHPKKHVQEAIADLERAKEILEKKLDK